MNEKTIARIKRNHDRTRGSLQYQDPSTTRRVWAKLDPESVLRLLEASAAQAHVDARHVLLAMAAQRWYLRATVHAGGRGRADRVADPAPHLTLTAGSRTWHLQVKEYPGERLLITRITA